ncbi:MAG: Fe(3+) ABC transporter substrate-binding protein [Alphaproteobacteria bacterium]|nr:Fe(3+) ABC transporter substrate-binding protein [Alphaproteobacteria bacterium]
MVRVRSTARTLVAAAAFALAGLPAALAAEVNVYSARNDALIKPLLDEFTAKTGIKANLLAGKPEQLLERLKSEGASSPADVLITTDAGNLWAAKEAGVLQPIKSATLDANIPAQLRDPEGAWFGLSQRARVIFAAKDRVKPGEITSYEDLADPKWKGRVCIRGSDNIYNQSLLAAMIATSGVEKAEAWAKGVTANMARKPQGGDRDQILAVAAGECDVAVANTYYYGGMLTGKKEDEKKAAEAVALVWPNQQGRGTHVNISGAAVTKSAKNKDEAVKLIEFLSGDEAQRIYAETNIEYPVKQGVAWSPLLDSWGRFKTDDLNVAALGKNNPEAVKIFDRVGWR